MKNKTVKKLLSFVLAAAMCLSTVACGQKENPTPSSSAQDNTAASGDEVAAKKYWEMLDEVDDTSDLPDWDGEILEVTIWAAGGSESAIGEISDTNVTYKELERVTGIRFVEDGSINNMGSSLDAMIPRLVAAKTFPTVIQSWDSAQQLAELYENGYLVDLTPYYEAGYLDHVTYWIPQDKYENTVYSQYTTADGELYAIPYATNVINDYDNLGVEVAEYDTQYYLLNGMVANLSNGAPLGQCIHVREDILQALYPDSYTRAELEQIWIDNGAFTAEEIFDVPLEDFEDFSQFLYDVDKLLESGDYVGLDGRPMETTFGPNTETDNWAWLTFLPMFIAGFGAESNYFTYVNLQAESEDELMVRSIDAPQYKEYMRGLNKLINDDVIAKNSLVDNAAAFAEKWTNGHYAVLYGNSTAGYPIKIDGSEAGWSYRPVWLKNPIDMTLGGNVTGGNVSDNIAIFKGDLTDAQIEQLVHAIDYMNSVVGINNFYWGPESAGLFTVDENGFREYAVEEVRANMRDNEDNGAHIKYGLNNTKFATRNFRLVGMTGVGQTLLAPNYAYKVDKERDAAGTWNAYNPGTIPGQTYNEHVTRLTTNAQIYGFGASNEDIKVFWAARAGFEAQVTKTIAAADFEKEYANLIAYADEYNLTKETVAKFGKIWVDANRDALKTAGIID